MSKASDDEIRLLRLDKVLDLIPVGRSSLYRAIKEGNFPPPIKIGGVSVWQYNDVRDWLRSKTGAVRATEVEDLI